VEGGGGKKYGEGRKRGEEERVEGGGGKKYGEGRKRGEEERVEDGGGRMAKEERITSCTSEAASFSKCS